MAAVATLCSIFPSDDGIHLLAHSEVERVKGIEPVFVNGRKRYKTVLRKKPLGLAAKNRT
jgi:hypothetical protein